MATITAAPKKTRTVLHLSLRDSLPAYGPITSLTFALSSQSTFASSASANSNVNENETKSVPELVCTTGTGVTGGFTLFQRDLPFKTKKKLLAVGGTRGLWALPVRQKANFPSSGGSGGGHNQKGGGAGGGHGVYVERGVNPFKKEGYDTLVVSTDATPSPGLSRVSSRFLLLFFLSFSLIIPASHLTDVFFRHVDIDPEL